MKLCFPQPLDSNYQEEAVMENDKNRGKRYPAVKVQTQNRKGPRSACQVAMKG